MEERNYVELHELREQIGLLKEKLQRQQIISEQNIIATAQKGIGKLNEAGIIWGILCIFALVFCSWKVYSFGCSDGFVIGTVIFLAICAAVTIYAHWGIHSIDIAGGNLVDISQRLIRFRKIYNRSLLYAMPMLVVWLYFFIKEFDGIGIETERIVISLVIGVLIGGGIGLRAHFKVIRDTDKVLANIKDLLQHKD